jgi:hypothetical protein
MSEPRFIAIGTSLFQQGHGVTLSGGFPAKVSNWQMRPIEDPRIGYGLL